MQLRAAFVRPTLENVNDSAGKNEKQVCDIMASLTFLVKASFTLGDTGVAP